MADTAPGAVMSMANASMPLLDNMLQYLYAGAALAATAAGSALLPRQVNNASCPGYTANNVQTTATGLTASLSLAGPACNSYGSDIENLKLTVNYDTSKWWRHVTEAVSC